MHWRALLSLTAFGLLYFHPLVSHPNQTLYSDHSDLLAEHVPAKTFLVRSFQQHGELPLWCPYLFCGSPFVHDIQVAMFYPPHLALLALPPEWVGAALSWLVVLHVLLAGWGMYAYACHRGLPPLAAFVAGGGFMLGGRRLMHLVGGGHYILIGLAWLPLVLLCLERAIRTGRLIWGVGAGVGFALLTLGTQPQWTFYAGIFAALWTFPLASGGREPSETREAHAPRLPVLWRWVGYGALMLALTLGLTAIQLLPTLEAAGQSSRSAGVGATGILQEGVQVLLFLVGPSLSAEPANLAWEARGGLAACWLLAAVLAPVLARGRVRYEAGLCVFLFLFAMGGAILFQPLPGFNLFRQPARMAVIATFPIAYLAGVTTQTLFAQPLSDETRGRCRWWAMRVAVLVVLLCGGFAVRELVAGKPLVFHPYWVMLPLTFGGACLILFNPRRGRAGAWAFLLAVDLFALTSPSVQTRPQNDVFPIPDYLDSLSGRVLDRETSGNRVIAPPLGSGAALAPLNEIEAVRGYSPLDTLRYREYLQFIAGQDQPLRALESPFTYPVLDDFNLKERSLLDLLGVRSLLLLGEEQPPGGDWSRGKSGTARVYDFLTGGMRELPFCTVWENTAALPRAFVVPHADSLPERSRAFETLRTADFRQIVLLENFDPEQALAPPPGKHREVKTRPLLPNRIELDAEGGTGGWLVSTEIWYPGWVCEIDGKPAKIHRANFLFRAVALPDGAREVVFRFEPRSYRLGRTVTLASAGLVMMMLVGCFAMLRSSDKDRKRGQ